MLPILFYALFPPLTVFQQQARYRCLQLGIPHLDLNLESVIADYAADSVLSTVVAAHGASMAGQVQMIAAHDPRSRSDP